MAVQRINIQPNNTSSPQTVNSAVQNGMTNQPVGSTESNADSNARKLWDMFSQDQEFKDKGCCPGLADKILKATKLLAYIILCYVVLAGVIATRGSLQILVTRLYNEIREQKKTEKRTATQDTISWLLLLIITIPDMFKVLQCVIQYMFGDRGFPDLGLFAWTLLKEVLHVVGLSGLVFKVMPFLGPVQISATLAVIPAIPATVYTITLLTKKIKLNTWPKLRTLSAVITSVLLVTGMISMCILNIPMDEDDNVELRVWMVLSCLMTSLRWVDTYRSREQRKWVYRKDPGSKNQGTYLNLAFSSSVRLVVAFLLFSQYFCSGIRDPGVTIHDFMNLTATVSPQSDVLPAFYVHVFTAVGVYYCAVVACRLCMQRICFTVPLSIASPIYVIVAMATSETDVTWVKMALHGTRGEPKFSVFISFAIFLIAWLFQLSISLHTWNEPAEKLSFVQRLFHLPHYCSPIPDLSLLHSRKLVTQVIEDDKTPSAASRSKVYIAATMWHETRTEMKQILTSIFKLDKHQSELSSDDPDFYNFEGHIPFDDAMTIKMKDGEECVEPNNFVKQLREVILDAVRAFYGKDAEFKPPTRVETPYGQRIEWSLPYGNKLYAHLKDKNKIRHKKRWSQIMYMYYGIGFNIIMKAEKEILNDNEANVDKLPDVDNLPESVKIQAENTYFLALDGDVDFEPEALLLLIDKMKQDPKVGATCGRIKPLGSGPVVWYQRFEYAIGHWLQKSAEHVFGCVLCSPGCFSLFRAKALMDNNVMRTYANLPSEPRHYLQYDQGEDRWLCTLLLQQGYRIEYCAAAEAWTYAPEEFKEFFNQRRRWLPSTMANILDLLESYRRTTKMNTNISYLYIFYTLILFLSSVLGPSTVLLAMASSIISVFNMNVWLAYVLVYGPALIFIFICLRFKSDFQLNVAMVLSALYALLMMAVLVGILVSIADEGWLTPTAIFFYILVASFVFAGLLHIHEFKDLLFGCVYFVCIPAGYLFLIIYAICNLNNVSWGTRETQKAVLQNKEHKKEKEQKKTLEFIEATQKAIESMTPMIHEKSKEDSCKDALVSPFRWASNFLFLNSVVKMQDVMRNNNEMAKTGPGGSQSQIINSNSHKSESKTSFSNSQIQKQDQEVKISKEEETFWNDLIDSYLKPIDHDEETKRTEAEKLEDFRDKIAFAFFFVNGLWIIVMTAMNHVKTTVSFTIYKHGDNVISIEPLGFTFLVLFAILLLMQMVGMIVHRYGTFLHVVAATKLVNKHEVRPEKSA